MQEKTNVISIGKTRNLEKLHRIVLAGHDNEGSALLFDEITNAYPDQQYLLVLCTGLYYRKSNFASLWKLVKEASWQFLFFRFAELMYYRISEKSLAQRAKEKGIPVIVTRDINSEETVNQIRAFAPDLLVSLYTMQLYREPVLSIPKYRAINSHPSILPDYRGLEVFFWALANQEKSTGVSIFYLSEKIDQGEILKQESVPIADDLTVRDLYFQVTKVAAKLLIQVIDEIDQDKARCSRITLGGRYFKMPDRAAYHRFRKSGKKFF